MCHYIDPQFSNPLLIGHPSSTGSPYLPSSLSSLPHPMSPATPPSNPDTAAPPLALPPAPSQPLFSSDATPALLSVSATHSTARRRCGHQRCPSVHIAVRGAPPSIDGAEEECRYSPVNLWTTPASRPPGAAVGGGTATKTGAKQPPPLPYPSVLAPARPGGPSSTS